MDISNKLQQYINEKKNTAITRNVDLYNELKNLTSYLPDSSSTAERIFHLNGGTKPICNNGNEYKWRHPSGKYVSCGNIKDGCLCAKLNQSKNISNYYKNKSIEEKNKTNIKREKTVKEKYGETHVSKNIKIKEKIKETNIDRYGVEWTSQNKDIKDKQIKTLIENHGVTSPLKSKDIYNKVMNTNIDRYGAVTPLQNNEIKEKIKEIMLKKYGVEHALQNNEIIQKKINTDLEKHGVKNYKQKHYSDYDLNLFYDDEFFKEMFLLHGIEKFIETSNINKYTIRDKALELNLIDKKPKSLLENKLYNILINIGLEPSQIIKNNRKIISPQEIDFIIEDYKIGIEICGLYWHSSKFLDNKYHIDKLKCVNDKGYRLLTIFEDELLYKTDIVEKRLKYLFKKNNILCGARKLDVRIIENKETKEFLENNHIQGNCPSSIKIGGYYNNELECVMTLGKKRVALGSKGDSEYDYELLRFSSKSNIPGAASKLLSFFKKNNEYNSIITYCDLRWNTGKLYENIGMSLVSTSQPNYYYFKPTEKKRLHRYNFTKHNLVKQGYDKNKTEFEIMDDNGWYRIYDCGHHKYILN